MAWELNAKTGLIMNGNLVVGSAEKMVTEKGIDWRVEILWSGPGGDITYEGPFFCIDPFIRGVEETIKRLGWEE